MDQLYGYYHYPVALSRPSGLGASGADEPDPVRSERILAVDTLEDEPFLLDGGLTVLADEVVDPPVWDLCSLSTTLVCLELPPLVLLPSLALLRLEEPALLTLSLGVTVMTLGAELERELSGRGTSRAVTTDVFDDLGNGTSLAVMAADDVEMTLCAWGRGG